MSTEFKREDRYIVIKRSDMEKLPADTRRNFQGRCRNFYAQMLIAGAPARSFLVIESDWPEYEPAWRMIEARMTGEPVAPQAHAQPGQAPSGITWRADGDANVYTLMRDGNWLASMRLNGELLTFQQEVLLNQFVGAEPSKALKEWKEWGEEASAEIDRLQGIEAERDTLRDQLAEFVSLMGSTEGRRTIRKKAAALSASAETEVKP